MSTVTQITASGETRDIEDCRIGDLSSLQTSEKESIVGAINEAIFNPFANPVECVITRMGGIGNVTQLKAVFYPHLKKLVFSGWESIEDEIYAGMGFTYFRCQIPGYTARVSQQSAIACATDSQVTLQAFISSEAGQDYIDASGVSERGGTFSAVWVYFSEITVDFEKSA